MNRQIRLPLCMTLIILALLESEAIVVLSGINPIAAIVLSLIIWIAGAACVMIKLRKQNEDYAYYEKHSFTNADFLTLFFAVTGGIAVAAGNYLYGGLMPLGVREFLSGNLLYTIRNLLYYPAEVLLMLELLMTSQKTGEILTEKVNIPWGAFALFILWGLPHILWHGFPDGIVAALRAFLYAVPFYAAGKNVKTSYIGMLILWLM